MLTRSFTFTEDLHPIVSVDFLQTIPQGHHTIQNVVLRDSEDKRPEERRPAPATDNSGIELRHLLPNIIITAWLGARRRLKVSM